MRLLSSVAAAAQADKAKAKTDLDAIQARYQPEVDAFAQELQAFAVTQGAPAEQMAAAAPAAPAPAQPQ